MRKMLTTLLLVAFCLTSRAEDKIARVTIVNKGTDQKIRIQREVNTTIIFKGFYDSVGTVQLTANQPFRLVCSKRKSNREYLYTTLIIKPGEHIFIDNLPDSLHAYLDYDPVRNNELAFFSAMGQNLGAFEGLLTYISHKRNDALALKERLTELHKDRLLFLNEYKTIYPISLWFDSLLVSAFRYKKFSDFYFYCQLEGITVNELHSENGYSEFAKELQYSKEQDDSIYFQEALLNRIQIELPIEGRYSERFYDWGEQCEGKTQEFILFYYLEKTTASQEVSQLLTTFQNAYSTTLLGQYSLIEFDEYVVDNSPDNKLLNVAKTNCIDCLSNLDKKELITWDSLINEPGVVKYIDFWASWCGGCRASFKDVRKLQEEYKNQNLKVAFVSIDALSGAWIKASEKEKLSNNENFLFLNFDESSVKQKYSIPPIARYMLIDKNGRVIMAEAPKPSSSELRTTINRLLSEK